MTAHRIRPFLAIPAGLVLVLAACTSEASPGASAASEPAAASEHASGHAVASDGGGADAGGDASQVIITGFQFEPAEITVAVGTEVVFVNEDAAPHTVTEGTEGQAADDAFVDEDVAGGEEVRVTFDEAGTFDITCRLHPTMQMTVVVEG